MERQRRGDENIRKLFKLKLYNKLFQSGKRKEICFWDTKCYRLDLKDKSA